MSKEPIHPFSRATVEHISWQRGEPSWMTERRLDAWSAFEAMGQPSVGPVALTHFSAFGDRPRRTVPSHEWPSDLQHSLDERGDEEGLIILRDSTVLSRSMTKEQAKKGVIFTDLDTAIKSVPDLVQRYGVSTLDTPQAALNAALWSGGSFLYVPPHVDVQLPFHTCYWTSDPYIASFPRTIIVAEAGSLVCFVDERLSGMTSDPGLSLSSVDIVVREKARVRYYDLQNLAESFYMAGREVFSVARSGERLAFRATMGGPLSDRRIKAELQTGEQTQHWDARMPPESAAQLEAVLEHLPNDPIREKIRNYVVGKLTGHRPTLTLERVAELHPEIRL